MGMDIVRRNELSGQEGPASETRIVSQVRRAAG